MPQDLNNQMSVQTGARQTMASWSRIIESFEAVPEIYKSFLRPYAGEGRTFPYTILSPSLDKFLRKTTEKLIYDLDGAIHILERSGNHVIAKSYPYKTLRVVEVGNILLSSWITVTGLTSEGLATSSTIDFNAATGERLFAVFLNKMRPAPLPIDNVSWGIEKGKFDFLAERNFKFMNYGRESLVRGENVRQIILQPAIRRVAWTFFGWKLYQNISQAHLSILTDKELILIRDDERGQEVRGVKYGGVWKYLPLRSLRSISLTEASNNLLNLVITLTHDETIKRTFEISNRLELEQFRDKIKPLIG